MNRGKTASLVEEDYESDIQEYLEDREFERETEVLISSFRKFSHYQEEYI